jgi:hypothetical protein
VRPGGADAEATGGGCEQGSALDLIGSCDAGCRATRSVSHAARIDSVARLRLKSRRLMGVIRRQRVLGALLLAALLLIPILASGHHHANATTPCAACAVTRHAPAVSVAVVSLPTVVPVAVVIEPLAATAPLGPVVRHAASRGPPALLLSREA